MKRPAFRVGVAIVIAYLFGWITGRLPAQEDPAEFWISNIGAPYLVIGFIAGAWATRRPATSAMAGAVCAVAAVCGFYNFAVIGSNARVGQGLPPGTPWLTAAGQAYERWLALLLWGSVPWLTIAVVVGLVAGYLGCRWAVWGSRAGVALTGAALILEPILHATGLNTHLRLGAAYAHSMHNIVIWGIEALVGVTVILASGRWTPSATKLPISTPRSAERGAAVTDADHNVAARLDDAVAARDADYLRTGTAGGGVVDLGKRRSPGR